MATEDDMREQLARLEQKVDRLESTSATKADLERFATKADLIAFRDEILGRFQVLTEDAKASVQKAAEGYGATLDRIEDDLRTMNRKLDDGLADHTRVLAHHNLRITELEGRQS